MVIVAILFKLNTYVQWDLHSLETLWPLVATLLRSVTIALGPRLSQVHRSHRFSVELLCIPNDGEKIPASLQLRAVTVMYLIASLVPRLLSSFIVVNGGGRPDRSHHAGIQ